jgi:putative ABC transport system permease protein
LRARLGRNIAIALAIMLGVSFVSGSFVLADSLKATFDNLFTSLNEDVDLQVRRTLTVDVTDGQRDPIPSSLLADVEAIPGVGKVEGVLQRYAQMIDKDGEPVSTQGAPAFGISWLGEEGSIAGVVLKDGRSPVGPDEVVIDKTTADRVDYVTGDEMTVVFDSGQRTFQIVGLVGLGNADGFGGATVSLFDPATAADVFEASDEFDNIDLQVTPGSDVARVQAAIADVLPPRTEVVTGEVVASETADSINSVIHVFGTGLLIFAFVTAFVSAFIINNIFGVTIGQRLRELALLRAVGASGRQVRRLIIIEALVVSVTATIIGIFGGLLVAKGIIALFNAAGGGFPPTPLLMQLRTVIFASVVGVGIALASVLIPARRASRIPPVAAMRPEIGFAAIGAGKRIIVGSLVTGLGATAFVVGMLVRPGGSLVLAILGGGGALAVFLGISSLSSTIARPVIGFIGVPVQKLFKVAGKLAVDNAQRSPRRTARTASALMIGVSLISAAAIFASSLRDTFARTLDSAVTADYIITDDSFLGLPTGVEERLDALPQLAAVSPFRFIRGNVNEDEQQLTAVDPVAFPQLANLDITDGSFDDLSQLNNAMLHKDKADDLAVEVGDEIMITYQNEQESRLTVAGIVADESLGSRWYISIATLESVSDQTPRDQFVLARLADDVDPADARPVIGASVEEFPQAKVQSNAEFRAEQEDQINQLLVIISVLLFFAIVIAIIGIAITLALAVFERTREIGLLRAVGMSRRKLRRAVRWEAVMVSVFGAIVGLVVGLFLGIVLSYAVPNNVIDGITFPWSIMVTILIAATIAGLGAAWWPARRAAKMNVLDAIASE